MINIDNLNLHYDKVSAKSKASTQVIFDLSLTISEGEKVAIIGPSGAGKSSLLHHFYQTLQQRAALCSQRQGLVDNLSIYHNVFMGALARHHWLFNLVNLIRPFKQHLKNITSLCQHIRLSVRIRWTHPLTQSTMSWQQRGQKNCMRMWKSISYMPK